MWHGCLGPTQHPPKPVEPKRLRQLEQEPRPLQHELQHRFPLFECAHVEQQRISRQPRSNISNLSTNFGFDMTLMPVQEHPWSTKSTTSNLEHNEVGAPEMPPPSKLQRVSERSPQKPRNRLHHCSPLLEHQRNVQLVQALQCSSEIY